MTAPEDFVRAQTRIVQPSLIPELSLYLADEMTPIWLATQTELDHGGIEPPFWAFCWPGGQALTRLILDQPHWVAGKRVLDFAAGSGISGIAAAKMRAARVTAAEIDAHALAAIALNAELNGVQIALLADNIVGRMDLGFDIVLAGDVCYEGPMATEVFAWFQALAGQGITILMGDPGRTYLPVDGLSRIAIYQVPTSVDLEDKAMRQTTVWRIERRA